MPDLWPYRPLIGAAEGLDWMTDVLGSRTSEQRIALRQAPRQSFDYTCRLNAVRYGVAKAFARRNGAVQVYVPVWAEEVYIGALAADATSLTFDTTAGDWRTRLVVWQDPETFAVASIDTVTDTDITLTGAIGTAFTNASVIPVRVAITPDGYAASRRDVLTDVSARFLVADNIDLAEEWESDYPQHEGLDVVTEAPILVNDVAESIVRSVDMIDNGFGPIELEPLKAYSDLGQMLSFVDARGAALWRRRVWLHATRGKQKSFWVPSFNADLHVTGSVGSADTTISINTIGPVGPLEGRSLMMLLKDGTRVMREIDAVAVLDPDTDQLTLSSAFGVAFDPGDVHMLSLMSKMRLNADAVTIEHRFDAEAVVTIPVTEVPA